MKGQNKLGRKEFLGVAGVPALAAGKFRL